MVPNMITQIGCAILGSYFLKILACNFSRPVLLVFYFIFDVKQVLKNMKNDGFSGKASTAGFKILSKFFIVYLQSFEFFVQKIHFLITIILIQLLPPIKHRDRISIMIDIKNKHQ